MDANIKKILSYTAMAPSSHNTQPWAVSVEGKTIFLYADFSRALHHSDPTNRELYISTGAALQNTIYAAEALGFKPEVSYFPEDTNELVAKIKLNSKNGGEDIEMLEAMEKRHSNRNKYHGEIPQEVLEGWEKLAKEMGVTANIVTNLKKKDQIANEVAEATIEAMNFDEFRYELSSWVRHNLTRAHDGMPGYGMGFPTLPSLLGPFMLKNFAFIGGVQAKTEKGLVSSASAVVIISGKDESLIWVKAGQAYEKIVLDATKRNIKNSTTAAAVEIGDHYKKLMKILEIKERPLMLFKLGYSDKIPKQTPKRTVEEILKS